MSDTTDIGNTDLLVNAPDQVGAPSTDTAETEPARPRRRGVGLSTMLLSELQALASTLGITGTARMRKGELVAAIEARQAGTNGAPPGDPAVVAPPPAPVQPVAGQLPLLGGEDAPVAAPAPVVGAAPVVSAGPAEPAELLVAEPAAEPVAVVAAPAVEASAPETPAVEAAVAAPAAPVVETAPAERAETQREERPRRSASRPAGSPAATAADAGTEAPAEAGSAEGARPAREGRQRQHDRQRSDRDGAERADRPRGDGERPDRGDRPERAERPDRQRGDSQRDNQRDGDGSRRGQNDGERGERPVAAQGDRGQGDRGQGNRNADRGNDRNADRGNDRNADRGNDRNNDPGGDDDGFDSNGRRRRGRFRDRNRRNRTDRFTEAAEPVIAEDDVLLPVAGILDILDNYAFIRTSGYLTGPNDVYVSLAQVRRYGLRRGDAVTGAVRQPKDGERRDKYNALVRLDTVNGTDADLARNRPEFTKLTPLYPQDRLRLETEPHLLTPRVIDLVMPIGKGQRALIVSPPKAGKTMILQAIANAITTNNPECHLMVVLVDERPEEVTDMQRSVKGEVVASTFDRPPSDHTTVAELSIERAKRLVELGHDVVVLLDSITRLGRAYNLAAPASGRILSGGVDSTALFPPKRFLGAARNIENGGSLTILATALIETGSAGDTVIFEEFKGTGNAELVLSRKIAEKRIFPAVDVDASGTRKEEILLGPDELAVIHKLRRVLHALDSQQALDLVLSRLKETRTNVEFLMQVQKTTVGPSD